MPSFSLANLSLLGRPEPGNWCDECRQLNRGNVSEVRKFCKEHRDPTTCGEDFEGIDEFELPENTGQVEECEEEFPEASCLDWCRDCRAANIYRGSGEVKLCEEHKSPFNKGVETVEEKDAIEPWTEMTMKGECKEVAEDKEEKKEERKKKKKEGGEKSRKNKLK